MHSRCGLCQQLAHSHRLTKGKVLYCLVLNKKGKRHRDIYIRTERHWNDGMLRFISPRFLQKGDFDKEIGETIWKGLNGYVAG